MGFIFSSLKGSSEAVSGIYVDFEKPNTPAEDKELYDNIAVVLQDATPNIAELRKYTGCGEQIRKVNI